MDDEIDFSTPTQQALAQIQNALATKVVSANTTTTTSGGHGYYSGGVPIYTWTGTSTSPQPVWTSSKDRKELLLEAMSHHPNSSLRGKTTEETARTVVDTYIEQFPDIDGTMTLKDAARLGAHAMIDLIDEISPYAVDALRTRLGL